MSVVINTNSAATIASNNLSASNAMLQRSLNRLSSGSKIVNASDDAGGVAVGGFEELNLAAELADEMAALDAGRLAHEDVDLVALGGTDHGEGNPGVAAGAFEDDGVGVQEPAGLSVFDDTEGEPVLDGAGGVEEFGLGVEGAVNLGEVQRDERGVADKGKDRRAGAGESGHGRRCGGAAEDRK